MLRKLVESAKNMSFLNLEYLDAEKEKYLDGVDRSTEKAKIIEKIFVGFVASATPMNLKSLLTNDTKSLNDAIPKKIGGYAQDDLNLAFDLLYCNQLTEFLLAHCKGIYSITDQDVGVLEEQVVRGLVDSALEDLGIGYIPYSVGFYSGTQKVVIYVTSFESPNSADEAEFAEYANMCSRALSRAVIAQPDLIGKVVVKSVEIKSKLSSDMMTALRMTDERERSQYAPKLIMKFMSASAQFELFTATPLTLAETQAVIDWVRSYRIGETQRELVPGLAEANEAFAELKDNFIESIRPHMQTLYDNRPAETEDLLQLMASIPGSIVELLYDRELVYSELKSLLGSTPRGQFLGGYSLMMLFNELIREKFTRRLPFYPAFYERPQQGAALSEQRKIERVSVIIN